MFKIKKLDFLISLYIFCVLIAELMGGKTFHLFNIGTYALNSSVAIFTLPIIFSINDVVIEVYGPERARSIVRSGLVVIFLMLLFSVLAVHLPASTRFSPNEPAYETIFKTSARIAASSLTAFAIAEFTDILIFQKIRERFGKKALWFRNNVSNFVSEFFDTTIFMFLAFYALDKSFESNLTFLVSLILPYWLLKCFMSIIETPFVYLGITWLKESDK